MFLRKKFLTDEQADKQTTTICLHILLGGGNYSEYFVGDVHVGDVHVGYRLITVARIAENCYVLVVLLWSPYVIGQTIIFSWCGLFFLLLLLLLHTYIRTYIRLFQ